jgi:hypothetical protein
MPHGEDYKADGSAFGSPHWTTQHTARANFAKPIIANYRLDFTLRRILYIISMIMHAPKVKELVEIAEQNLHIAEACTMGVCGRATGSSDRA